MAKSARNRQSSLVAGPGTNNIVLTTGDTPMSDPDPTTSSADTNSAESSSKAQWRDQRRADKHARRESMREWRHHGGWGGPPIGGIVLLVVGVLFLLGTFGFHLPPHWWALLIMIPAVSLLVAAIRFYRVEGTTGRVVGPAIGGFVLLALSLSLFFGFHGGFFWSVILIAVGAALIARRSWWMRHQPPKA
jgi:hypothetical protein